MFLDGELDGLAQIVQRVVVAVSELDLDVNLVMDVVVGTFVGTCQLERVRGR